MTGTNGSSNGSGNGKFDASQVVEDLLGKLNVEVPTTATSNGTRNGTTKSSTATNDVQVLKQAQLDLKHLQQVQAELDHKIRAKKNQVKDLLLQVSPLSCITQHDIDTTDSGVDDTACQRLLGHLVSYLDEEALWKLERALPSLLETPATVAQWNYLDVHNPFRSNSIDLTARERCIQFVLASRYAQQMETAAKYHYNPRQYIHKEYEWPDKLYAREDFQNDFYAFDNGDEPPPALEFFVRITYRLTEEGDEDSPTKCLLEGFLSDYSDLDPWQRDKYTIIELGDNDNTHVHMVCNDIYKLDDPQTMGLEMSYNWRNKLSLKWPLEEQQAYMKRISLTVLACAPSSPPVDTNTATMNGNGQGHGRATPPTLTTRCPLKSSQLVVATRGYKKTMEPNNPSQPLAVMPPRSYLAKARTANLLDCVNVALKPTEEQNGKIGFRILIEWGTQEVFTRRKSIFDPYG